MSDAERYTFSSLMSLLIESERKLKGLYEEALSEINEEKLKLFISEACRQNSRRVELMHRARIERVVEMTLEPITDLKLSDLIARMTNIIESKNVSSVQKTIRMEKAISELYVKVAPKIMGISSDTGELILALSRESNDRQDKLEQYVKFD